MLPTPWRSDWLRSAALMGVLRLRKRAMKSSSGIVRGSAPGPSYLVSGATTDRRPERRGAVEGGALALFGGGLGGVRGGAGEWRGGRRRGAAVAWWTGQTAGWFTRGRSLGMGLES